jgi:hypothetical protein
MGVSNHTLWLPLGGTLAYISPGTSAYWYECLYPNSGLLLCSRTRKPYLSLLVYFLCAKTQEAYRAVGGVHRMRVCRKICALLEST